MPSVVTYQPILLVNVNPALKEMEKLCVSINLTRLIGKYVESFIFPPGTDIDECALNPDICGLNADCINVPGNYTCACRDGYRNDPCELNSLIYIEFS